MQAAVTPHHDPIFAVHSLERPCEVPRQEVGVTAGHVVPGSIRVSPVHIEESQDKLWDAREKVVSVADGRQPRRLLL
jgi:uncharacterized protein (DUF779 family)